MDKKVCRKGDFDESVVEVVTHNYMDVLIFLKFVGEMNGLETCNLVRVFEQKWVWRKRTSHETVVKQSLGLHQAYPEKYFNGGLIETVIKLKLW